MRPEILYPLFADITTIDGVGEKNARLLEKLTGSRYLLDLIFHIPYNYIDRRNSPNIYELQDGEIATLIVSPEMHFAPAHNSPRPYKIQCANETGSLNVIFFRTYEKTMRLLFPVGRKVAISGKVELYDGVAQMIHPEVLPADKIDELKIIEPVYHLTAGVSNRQLGKFIKSALKKLPDLDEWISPETKEKFGFGNWKESIISAHNADEIDDENPANLRLAFDEIMANQLSLALFREKARSLKGQSLKGDGSLRKKLLEILPFTLTQGQEDIIAHINDDLISDAKMLRLLQGDVGSGKTIISLFGMLQTVECGKQAALMSPTTILANQHYNSLKPFLDELGISYTLLTGTEGKKSLHEIQNGNTQIIFGTHALFQKGVEFHDLAFVVIDEQHRFGVNQRMELMRKGNRANLLLMSATPIPRSLVFTLYGDMDCSHLTEKPVGRQEIDTRIISLNRFSEVLEAIKRALENNEKIYWICPLVSESEKSDMAAAVERFEQFRHIFGDVVGLIHGRLKSDEKHNEMEKFHNGTTKILIATTVVEVGMDVKDASIMVIEHAERFGFSQLHQLRGRIGRNDKKSTCLLLYGKTMSENGLERLKVLRETNDGFKIAEADLKMRGAGDLLGTKQSGALHFKVFDLEKNKELIQPAKDEAQQLITRGNTEKIALLLHLYGYAEYEKFMNTG